MKAVVLERYGSPETLRIDDLPRPVPSADQVLVRVHAASINDWDWCLVRGTPFYIRLLCGLRRPRVRIPGVDIAGRVEHVGHDVTRFAPGDEVYGDLSESGFGGFAEYVCAPETALAVKPPKLSFEAAAAVPHAAALAVQGLVDLGAMQAGQRLLINGAGGGVGTLGVQLATSRGLRGMVGVDTAAKAEAMKAVGFAEVIEYRQQDFTATGDTYDLILDTKTDRSIFRYARALRDDGRYVTVGGRTSRLLSLFALGKLARFFTSKRFDIVALRPNEGVASLSPLLEDGTIQPVIDGPYPFDELPTVLRRFGEGRHIGKVVVTMPGRDSAASGVRSVDRSAR